MKFNLEVGAGNYTIESYGAGRINIAVPGEPTFPGATRDRQESLTRSFIITPAQLVRDWPPQTFKDLTASHFDALAALQPEVVLLGCGARLRFLPASLSAALTEHAIGVEAMDTGAACRTYNILMAEGRNVAAALLMI